MVIAIIEKIGHKEQYYSTIRTRTSLSMRLWQNQGVKLKIKQKHKGPQTDEVGAMSKNSEWCCRRWNRTLVQLYLSLICAWLLSLLDSDPIKSSPSTLRQFKKTTCIFRLQGNLLCLIFKCSSRTDIQSLRFQLFFYLQETEYFSSPTCFQWLDFVEIDISSNNISHLTSIY